jgi:hypothetical protein
MRIPLHLYVVRALAFLPSVFIDTTSLYLASSEERRVLGNGHIFIYSSLIPFRCYLVFTYQLSSFRSRDSAVGITKSWTPEESVFDLRQGM